MNDDDQRSGDELAIDAGPQSDGADIPLEFLELDPVFEALGHPRRRYLCYTLTEKTAWSMTDLASKIAAWEYDVPEHAVTDVQRDEVYISLQHAHVPKLVDEEVISVDEELETIRPAGNATQVLAALDGIGASVDSALEDHARSEMDDAGRERERVTDEQ